MQFLSKLAEAVINGYELTDEDIDKIANVLNLSTKETLKKAATTQRRAQNPLITDYDGNPIPLFVSEDTYFRLMGWLKSRLDERAYLESIRRIANKTGMSNTDLKTLFDAIQRYIVELLELPYKFVGAPDRAIASNLGEQRL